MIAYQVNDSLLAGGESVKVDALLSILNLTSSYSQSDKISSGYLANILAHQPAKVLADVSAKIYANQLILTTVGGWDSSENLKRGKFTPFAKGDFSHLSKDANYPHWQGLNWVTTRGGIEFCESIKGKIIEFLQSIKKGGQSATLGNVDIEYRASENYQHSDHFAVSTDKSECLVKNFDDNHFTFLLTFGYSKNALAKSSVRIGTLSLQTATHDAPCVFFCIYAYAYLLNAVLYRAYSMVALVRQPSGWLVSVCASSSNLANVTTPIEIGTSGGDSELKQTEIIVMMATPTQTQFKFLFLSIKRSDTTAKPCRIAVTAPNENSARLMLVRDYILSFAGRLPAQEVTA
ncbi:host cell division inhibitor Icd-like protein [Providencia stuartii]|uniref:host cell division inhibitor Icd-like protein n=1 Tax=Providencia stuartii TaxID=588 RepID=UPI0023E0A8D5|nr:host cell division inhibitor Icd-like protein [Providencia stuartii]ELR5143354.1 host cell division inhibitor Icd-like protein [Providencia stuartii]WER20881.1 host cell division inhibitor Icd-like protein [Providencia stuartii]WER25001.1 host cell division inhibitor Icd-like protein [Providencia stuartii]WER29091.1 host cell division inhibitor Icd-like protein [Providencia stuartii]